MTCGEFEEALNHLVDAGLWPRSGGPLPGLVTTDPARHEALEQHRRRCTLCQRKVRNFERLGRALEAVALPGPSSALADRITARAHTTRSHRVPVQVWAWRAGVTAVAACLVVMLGLAVLSRAPVPGHDPPVVARTNRPGVFGGALADAAVVTLELAREASEPAARLGAPLVARTASAVVPKPSMEVLPSLSLLAPDTGALAGVLNRVGGRLFDGVRPLSRSARRTFELFAEPMPGSPPTSARPDSKGA